jgi:poly-beta-1,6-N-acetyl-D-glucosamine biosynthesis protein PgaD
MIRSAWIIDVASGRPAWLRWRDWILSVAMWVLYLYLIREVFTDVYRLVDEGYAWAFLGAPHPSLPTVFRFVYTLGLYSVIVVINGMVLIGWATYNRYRFRGPDHRRAIGKVSPTQLGQFYGFPAETVAEWQQARSLIMIHDAEGKLLAAVPKPVDTVERASNDQPASMAQKRA